MFNDLFQHDEYSGTWRAAEPVAGARRTDPATSHAAARRYDASGARAGHVSRIMEVVRQSPGVTAHQIAEATALHVTQVDRRASELERSGLIERHGQYNGALRWWPKEAK